MAQALRSAGYELGAPAWLSTRRSTWITVAVTVLVVLVIATAAGAAGLGDLIGRLTSPTGGGLLLVLTLGLAAGFPTCMAMVGGLVLAFSATHAAAGERSGRGPASLASRLRPHVAFNVSRVIGFGVRGAAMGALPSADAHESAPHRAAAARRTDTPSTPTLLARPGSGRPWNRSR